MRMRFAQILVLVLMSLWISPSQEADVKPKPPPQTPSAVPSKQPPYKLPPGAAIIPKVLELTNADPVMSVAFIPNSPILVTGSFKSRYRLWDVQSGQVVKTITAGDPVGRTFALSPDGRLIAGGSFDNSIKLWEVATGNVLSTFQSQTDRPISLAFSPSRSLILSGSNSGATLWDAEQGHLLYTFTNVGRVDSVAFSADGKLAVLSSTTDTKLVNVGARTVVRAFGAKWPALFSPDGRFIVSGNSLGSFDRTVRFFDVSSGVVAKVFDPGMVVHDNTFGVAFSPDGKLLVSVSWGGLTIFDTLTGNVKTHILPPKEGLSLGISFTPDSQYVIAASFDQTIRLYRVESGDLVETFFSVGDDWAAFTPTGWYTTSRAERPPLALARNGRELSINSVSKEQHSQLVARRDRP